MSIEPPTTRSPALEGRRQPLSRERILATAVDVADRGGAEALSMRKLGQELTVDPMALYRHVRNKDDLLDGALAVVVGQMEPAPPGLAWKPALRELAMNARRVMLRHPWARGVLEERGTAGETMVGQVERVLSILLGAGFDIELAVGDPSAQERRAQERPRADRDPRLHRGRNEPRLAGDERLA